jgi:class 3 adenylate cyclase
MGKLHSRTWTWRFDGPVEGIWPVLADTARFNEAAGLPKHEIEEIARPDGSVLYLGRLRFGPFRIEWEDEPVNWVEGRWFRHRRRFRNGPLKSLSATLRFSPAGGGCTGEYTLEAEPANTLGILMLAAFFFRNAGRTFTRLAENARDFAKGERAVEFDAKPPVLAPGGGERAARVAERIEASPHGHGLARRLAEWVTTRQEVDVWTIRPLKLARLWNVPERQVIELCLEAVKQGLLLLRWDLLCPRCRVGKASAASLDQLPTGAHCSTCNIRYDRSYAKNVELAFQPARAIRPVEPGEYCLFGPMSTPHVKLQLTLAPGEERTEALDLGPGSYRVRTLEPGPEEAIDWPGGAFPAILAGAAAGGEETISLGPPAPAGRLHLRNGAGRPLTFVLEEREWARDALTAHRATALQAFRDIFTDEVLRPGDAAEVDRITLMFTDLKGSTALYGRIGDATAYALVREHFAILAKAVRECEGAIVKTIGDAIMAAFLDPADGLRCALRIQDDFARFNAASGKEPVIVKLGLHVGRCIAVTLNDKLDYYGSAANMTARLESRSRGGDVVVSIDLARDPEVARLLAGFRPLEEKADLKGFAEPVPYLRITAEELASRRN